MHAKLSESVFAVKVELVLFAFSTVHMRKLLKKLVAILNYAFFNLPIYGNYYLNKHLTMTVSYPLKHRACDSAYVTNMMHYSFACNFLLKNYTLVIYINDVLNSCR